jgi:hypothetical protein
MSGSPWRASSWPTAGGDGESGGGEVAVAAGLEGVQVFRDLCVGPCRFELIDYMAVVAFRELPR